MRYFQALGMSRVSVLVDVGANEGQFLLPALRYLEPAQAVAIEMLPDLAGRLRTRCPAHVRVVECAVGRRAGRMPILRSIYSPASSLLPLMPQASALYGRDLHQEVAGEVQVRTLDEIYAQMGLHWVDLLKLDVQGYELEALSGGTEALQHTSRVIAEVQFVPIYESGALFSEVCAFMEAQGFALSLLFQQARSVGGTLMHADALFTSRRKTGGDAGCIS